MEFWRYYRIVRKRRWLIVLGMLICVGAVQFNNMMAVPTYVARTTVMESTGMSREGTPLFAEPYTQLDTQLRLSNLANLATSNKVIAGAVESLADLGMKATPEEILSHTSVQPVRDTNILAIEITLADPQEAKIAADVIASEFRKAYAELNNAAISQSREFIAAQIETTKRAMVKAQDALRDFKEQHSLIDLDQQSMAAVQLISQAKSQLNQARIARQRAVEQVSAAQDELQKLPEWQTASEVTSRNPTWERLTTSLTELETTKAGMLNGLEGQPRRGPNHPDVVIVTQRIEDVNEKLQGLKEEYISSSTEARNPAYAGTLDRWLQSKIEEASQIAHEQAADVVVSEAKSELADLPEYEARLAALQTDVQAATSTYGLMRTKLDEAKIREQQAMNEVALKTIDTAHVTPVNQKQNLKLILAILLSPILGVGAALLLHYTDNTVKTASEAEKLIGLPVLSVVPGARGHSLPRQKCPEIVDVAYQMLTSNLWIANQNQGVNAVAVVSAEPDVGRSVTASNLATSLAREGAKVVLVDADLRQPTQHLIFGVDNKVGLSNVLSGAASLEDALAVTRVQGLLLMPTGPVPDNPVKLLRSAEMKDLCEQISRVADFVVYDTPAGVTFPDPVLVATQVGSAVVVHSAGRVPRGSEMEFRERLEAVGVRLLGTVLNRVKREDSSGYFHYRRSYESMAVAQLPGGKKATRV